MRKTFVLLCLALACLTTAQAAVYRRGDKISENFKQLDLAPEEIDPNVAPSAPNKIETFDESTDESLITSADNEIVNEAEEQTLTTGEAANEIIDESANEIAQAVATAAPAVVTTAAPAAAATPVNNEDGDAGGLAKYCKCTENYCDCCRTFNLPFIPVKGPGCARMTYLGNEKMSVSLKYGDLTLASRTVSNKRARPICVGLPGGYSQFCGRVYGLSKAKENFKACLGFELRADDEVEAALRVSCFKFGPEGLRVADAEPLPSEVNKEEDDDDGGLFGFAAGGDDEDEDDYDEEDDDEEEADEEVEEEADDDTDYADDASDDNEEAPADADYGGFSLAGLLDELDDDEEDETKPSSTLAAPVAALATLAPAADTRTAVGSAQSKDNMGTAAADATETVAEAVASTVDEVTPASEVTLETSTAKTKKSKKGKKNKKKKAVDAEGDFAYDLLNGLLAFFN